MVKVTCIKCGNTFQVSERLEWTYTDWCDHCIQRDNRGNENQRELREDARDEFNESSKELYEATRVDNV